MGLHRFTSVCVCRLTTALLRLVFVRRQIKPSLSKYSNRKIAIEIMQMNRRGSWNHIASKPVSSADADNRNVLRKVFFFLFNNEYVINWGRETKHVLIEAYRTEKLIARMCFSTVILEKKLCRRKSIILAMVIKIIIIINTFIYWPSRQVEPPQFCLNSEINNEGRHAGLICQRFFFKSTKLKIGK